MKLPATTTPGKAAVGDDRLSTADDAEALAAQKLNAEVGTKIAEARRLQETDPDKAIAIYEQTLKAVKAAGTLAQTVARTMARRLEVAIELAKKDKVAFDVKMQDKTAAGRDRASSGSASSRPTRPRRPAMKELMDKAQAAYAKGEYAEAEAYAKRAMEVDPERGRRVDARLQGQDRAPLQAATWTRRRPRRRGPSTAFQEVDVAVDRRPRGPAQRDQVPQELQGPDPRAAAR